MTNTVFSCYKKEECLINMIYEIYYKKIKESV